MITYAKRLQISAQRNLMMGRYELFPFLVQGEDHVGVGTLTIKELGPDDRGMIVEPIALSDEAAQHLIDELWKSGLRPSEGHGSAGQLAATQAHLEDMRGMVKRMLECVLTVPTIEPQIHRGRI